MSNTSSGLDVSDIVTQLMKIEHKSLDRLNKNKSIYDAQLKSYDDLKGLLSKFTQTLDQLDRTFKNNTYTVHSSEETIFSVASTGGTLSTGVHSLTVSQLAQAHQLAGAPLATKDTALALTGQLGIAVGTASFEISLQSDDSLVTLRDHINQAANNPGVTASILSTTALDGSTEHRLLLSSNETGVANAMMISGDLADSLNVTQILSAPQNAQFTFDSFDVERASNTVSDLMDGLVIHLNGAMGAASLQVSANTSTQIDSAKDGVQAVVEAYNAVIHTIDSNQSSRVLHDSTYALVKSNVASAIKPLLNFGVKIAESQKLHNSLGTEYVSNGALKVDPTQLGTQLREHFQLVKNALTVSDTGLIATLHSAVKGLTAHEGTLENREAIISKQGHLIDNRITHEDVRLERVRDQLIRQYSALDTTIQHYQHISDFLTNQIAAWDFSRKH